MAATLAIPTTLTICKVEVALADGLAYPLTACCAASAKGSADGVVCRGCYAPLPAAWGGSLEAVLAEQGCPDPSGCADHARYTLEREQEDRG